LRSSAILILLLLCVRTSLAEGSLLDRSHEVCSRKPLSEKELFSRDALFQELEQASLGLRAKPSSEHQKLFQIIVAKHRDKLSSPVLRSTLATANRKMLEKVLKLFKANSDLSRKYLLFLKQTNAYRVLIDKFMRGNLDRFRGRELLASEEKMHDKSFHALVDSVTHVSLQNLDANTRRLLLISIIQTAKLTYSLAPTSSTSSASRLYVRKSLARRMSSSDELIAAWLTNGLAIESERVDSGATSAISKAVHETALGTKAGNGLIKMSPREDNIFFCQLAREIQSKGDPYVEDSLVAAGMGLFFGNSKIQSVAARQSLRQLSREVYRVSAEDDDAKTAKSIEQLKTEAALPNQREKNARRWHAWADKMLKMRGKVFVDSGGQKVSWSKFVNRQLENGKSPTARIQKPKPILAAKPILAKVELTKTPAPKPAPSPSPTIIQRMDTKATPAEKLLRAVNADGAPLFSQQDRALLLGVDKRAKLTVIIEGVFGEELTRQMTAEKVIRLAGDRTVHLIRIQKVHAPATKR